MSIKIPDNILRALDMLEAAGFEAYAVGGCVRDGLLGKTPYDWDICTSALPQETVAVFSAYRTIPTGIKHGTVTAIIGEPLEITTFRIDGDYLDNRRPTEVEFTRSLADDLCRRDFTVNAMALDKSGRITDLYGGREDLKNRIIRCVGNAEKRFDEDALRIMRALRFAATLGFEIEAETATAILKKKKLLLRIAAERIQAELNKLLLGNCADILVTYPEVFAVFLPEAEITRETANKIQAAPTEIEIRLALLFVNDSEEQAVNSALRRMKYSNSVTTAVTRLCENKNTPVESSRSTVKRLLNRFGEVDLLRLLRYKTAAGTLTQADYEKISQTAEEIISRGECFSLSALAVNGRDLSALGMKQKQIGSALHYLLESVIDGEENTKENLIRLAESRKQSL